jgi:uncharacterized protein (DUF3820 family)
MQSATNELILLNTTLMPFGKYQGLPLIDLPEPYVVWFHEKGFPEGKLGHLLGLLYEVKLNGLEQMVRSCRGSNSGINDL